MDKNKIQNSDGRYFRTASFYTACFLFAKGHELVNVDRVEDPKRAQFVFTDSTELAIDVHNFNFAKESSQVLQVNVRIFITAIKQIKNALYQWV